ncbi:beta-galactosidase [Mucilaginibacter sp. MD40]|uniref:glycoside hydrolase family 2 protein n=1 Tax=Mucilaginibacter sp. MD40 TaxID=2029590 RepID=UPI000BAC8AA2|nr:glycoside hydrolase family 2 TIM barrel-domain containing protein [Mucilaginibacter sp. MD40]PAW92043.1 beta-galactosidase [Mucilaginibacter sp. MD40]
MRIQVLFVFLFIAIRFVFISPDSKAQNGPEKISIYAKAGRASLNFNRDWKFDLGDQVNGASNKYNDSGWSTVGLPHSFSIPYFMSTEFYIGYGWYRKHFSLENDLANKKAYLDFEGVFQEAEIFVNGQKMGSHKGGYTGFRIDISGALKKGDNLVAVRVNNVWNAALAPRAGEHVFSGGIYRDVKLVIVNPVHIDWYGSFITTPLVNKKTASVKVQTDVANTEKRAVSIEVQTVVLSPSGKTVGSASYKGELNAGTSQNVEQNIPNISNPRLWHPDHPYLYTLITKIYRSGKQVDETQQHFGIRSIRWTADSGFFLNGKHFYIRGINVHQDHAGWGDAVTNTGFVRDVQMMKDAGFNFIRGSHYPHDPAFAEACDKIGMLLWSENNFWGIGGSDNTPEGYWNSSAYPTHPADSAAFNASAIQELKEMIHIYRNHPSIIAWSVSNEPFFTAQQTVEAMRNLLKKLVATVHKADPSRPAAIGGAQRPLDSLRIDILGDVAGYNGDGSIIELFRNPGVANIVSEYGSTSTDRPGKYEPGWGDLSVDNGQETYAWRSGQAMWCGYDHGSIAGLALSKMGIVDYFRIPKRAWYWYRNEYKHIPPPVWPEHGKPVALKLQADKLTANTDGTDDIKLTVSVLDESGKLISNSPDVQLEVISGPGEFPTGPSILFSGASDIRIMDGQAAIEYRSWFSGKSVVKATSPGLKPAIIEIDFKGNIPFIDGVTPKASSRPYTRFSSIAKSEELRVFGRNNPTFSSSSAANHISGYAADGHADTWWLPVPSDAKPYWILDTEKGLEIKEVDISFPKPDIYQYIVETSDDRKNWYLLKDFTRNSEKKTKSTITLEGIHARAIRISFIDSEHAGLSEVRVTGKVLK